jgi:DNA helicase-2/ATP-dependent DNA helicase PcrA
MEKNELNVFIPDADKEIQEYINNPKSFFLFAGAGSGKTRSLVNALIYIHKTIGTQLQYQGKKVAVITYTNAACDEIKRRLEFNPLFDVSTIHHFVWILIKPFSSDIKLWLFKNLQEEIATLNDELAKGRPGTKTEIARKASLASKEKRLQNIEKVTQFNYNPNGENSGYNSLNHTEVIKIASDFLATKPLMQHILISQYPILFIDESQDTNKNLMEAVLTVELIHRGKFLLGLFGDTMQRIYLDGKADLGMNLPEHWAKPAKLINYRSPVRVIELINKIRKPVDGLQQIPAEGRENGIVRLFLISNTVQNKDEVEALVQEKMKSITQDDDWTKSGNSVKKLILEHHMAANRLGFSAMFDALYSVDKFRTGILDGTLSAVKLFSHLVLPVLIAKSKGDEFTIANIVQKHSPLLEEKTLKSTGDNQLSQLKKAYEAVNKVYETWNGKNPTFKEILDIIGDTNLFEVPTVLQAFLINDEEEIEAKDEPDQNEDGEEYTNEDLEQYKALETWLESPFNQVRSYTDYIDQKTSFDTHQGIKGREFLRVMVIIDDSEAKGFLYKYDKLFEVEPMSKTDRENEKEGKDSAISRPKRLFYVTCSRAESSLAIVAYTKDILSFKAFVIKEGWFQTNEIEVI